MSSLLRSDHMSLCEMYLQPEVAYVVIDEIGKMGFVQFNDMTPNLTSFQRKYITEIRRLSELLRKLQYIKTEMNKHDILLPELWPNAEVMLPHEINDYEAKLEKLEQDVANMDNYQVRLMTNLKELAELYYVVSYIGPILGDVELRADHIFGPAGGDNFTGVLSVKTGVIKRSKAFSFEMMLWRLSRGNIFYKTALVDKIFVNPFSGNEVRKLAFVAICQGEVLSSRVDKVCAGFHAKLYSVPVTKKLRREMSRQLQIRLKDLEHVLRKTKYHRCKALRVVGRNWDYWHIQILKAKGIYTVMNLFSLDITRGCLIGQCWVPTTEIGKVNSVLEASGEKAGSRIMSFMTSIKTKATPPTFHRNNKFTSGFQALIAAYGDAGYMEINPGIFTIITFPFLFAIMFGDLGHAMIMVTFASWMLYNEKKFTEQKSSNEIWNIFFSGRYIIFLMGLFSMFTGFVYNDLFSKKMAIMPSYWLVDQYSAEKVASAKSFELDPMDPSRPVYYFGVDPVWGIAGNVIVFENSLKMKLSIIVGVIHMIFGLILSLFNHLHFKRYHAIPLEFIPQILFLVCLFFWLVIMMYMKWFMYNAKQDDINRRPGCAPLILILFIDMMLFKTSESKEADCQAYMFSSQNQLQRFLLITALITVPIMLLGSPIYTHIQHGKLKKAKKLPPHDEYSFGEVMIHQSIHTVEFVLSTVSHTASYLRLWALSLAHAQLSEMLWTMVLVKTALRTAEHGPGIFKTYIIFAVWSGFSVSILVLMEGLSAFLHTLRLHWVEFMSKFFIGSGVVFSPFSYELLKEDLV